VDTHPRTPWILLVEDEPLLVRTFVRWVAAQTDCAVVVDVDGQASVAVLDRAEDAPVAVILDGNLGAGRTGAAVLGAIRRAGHAVPCAFWSSLPPEAVADLLRANGLVERPPVFEKLDLDAVLGWLRGASGRQTRLLE
jgi:DNA-binding response OmpR family regulator